MTRLRVLTGEHAGAALEWTQDRIQVGSNEELDVYIGDWNTQQIELQRDDSGRHVARWSMPEDTLALGAESPDGDGFVCVLQPWVPVRFGAIILCIGPSEEVWPDDAQLLLRCFAPAPVPVPAAAPPQPPRRAPLAYALGAVMTVAILQVSSATLSTPGAESVGTRVSARNAAHHFSPNAQPMAATSPVQQVRDTIDAALRESLDVVASGDHVVVRGVLASRSAVDELHLQLDRLPYTVLVSRRVLSVGEIVDRLHESLPASGLSVKQTGLRRFEFSGMVADLPRATRKVQPVVTDLGEFGLQIDIALQSRSADMPTMSGMMVDGQGGTSFMRTRDGTKHIVTAAQARDSASTKDTSTKDTSRNPPLAPQALETPHAKP
jgi:type III secretion protein D